MVEFKLDDSGSVEPIIEFAKEVWPSTPTGGVHTYVRKATQVSPFMAITRWLKPKATPNWTLVSRPQLYSSFPPASMRWSNLMWPNVVRALS